MVDEGTDDLGESMARVLYLEDGAVISWENASEEVKHEYRDKAEEELSEVLGLYD